MSREPITTIPQAIEFLERGVYTRENELNVREIIALLRRKPVAWALCGQMRPDNPLAVDQSWREALERAERYTDVAGRKLRPLGFLD